MIRVGLAQAEGPSTEPVVEDVIRCCRRQLGRAQPQAGILFAGAQFDHRIMLDRVRRAFPSASLIGCTTAGDFSTAYGFSEDSISLMLLRTDPIRMATGVGPGLSRAPLEAVQTAVAMARDQLDEDPGLCLVLADGTGQPMDRIVNELGSVLPDNCPVFGGCAARAGEVAGPARQFHNSEILEDALSLLLFSGPVRFAAAVANSWRPIGEQATVTRSSGCTVERIGDSGALDFYYHYLGVHHRPAIDFPLAVYLADGHRVTMRGPVAYDVKTRTVTFTVPISEGSRVQLTEASRPFILDDTRRSATELSTRLTDFQPAFGLAFSCFLRKEVLGTRTSEELDALIDGLPAHLPLLGFYSYGEIGPLSRGDKSVVHNATLVTLVVGDCSENAAPLECGRDESVADRAGSNPDRLLCDQTGTEALHCEIEYLRKKLIRSENARRRLEDIKELNASLYRKVLEEAVAAREKIRRQEAEIRKSEEKYRRIIETTGQGFLMMDENAFITDCNPAACRMMGYTREEIIGLRPIDMMHPAYRDFFSVNREEILAKDHRELETVMVTKDGRDLPILIHGNTLRDAEGAVLGHMAFVTDMSEQKKALALAAEVQKGLLPNTAPRFDGLDICGKSLPCDEVGGDYFDFLYGDEYPNHRFSVVVGDVTGHGVDAALLMSSARAFLRMRASQPGSMAEVITSLNRHLSLDVLESGRFMSLFYLCIGPGNRFIRWVRAGLDPALVYLPEVDEFQELMGEGMVLGLYEDWVYQENRLADIASERILVIGTDGIWEAHDKQDRMFGKDRFKQVIRSHAGRSAAQMVDAVFTALDEFTLGMRPQDDRTLVIVKVTPM